MLDSKGWCCLRCACVAEVCSCWAGCAQMLWQPQIVIVFPGTRISMHVSTCNTDDSSFLKVIPLLQHDPIHSSVLFPCFNNIVVVQIASLVQRIQTTLCTNTQVRNQTRAWGSKHLCCVRLGTVETLMECARCACCSCSIHRSHRTRAGSKSGYRRV